MNEIIRRNINRQISNLPTLAQCDVDLHLNLAPNADWFNGSKGGSV